MGFDIILQNIGKVSKTPEEVARFVPSHFQQNCPHWGCKVAKLATLLLTCILVICAVAALSSLYDMFFSEARGMENKRLWV